jgi:hypothetical protein
MTTPKLPGSPKRRAAAKREDPLVNTTFFRTVEYRKVRTAVWDYLYARSRLSDLGVLRSNRELQGELAEWFVSELLGLRREASFHTGCDAVDANGGRYEIKSRKVPNLSARTSFDFTQDLGEFDWFLGVFFSEELDPLAVVRIQSTDIAANAGGSPGGHSLWWTEERFREPWVETIWRADSAPAASRRLNKARQRGNSKGNRYPIRCIVR